MDSTVVYILMSSSFIREASVVVEMIYSYLV